MSPLRHHTVDAGVTRLHVVEQGEGPLVVLVHGFPESWYSWRHQLPALAAAGYRAVAFDVRGYGRSSKPPRIEDYRMLALVADTVNLVGALGETAATIVGHDWGSPIASTSALLRPDLFTRLGLLSVPYSAPGGRRPTEAFAAMGGEEEFYINYFQEPGRAEREIEADVRSWLHGFYLGASGAPPPSPSGGSLATVPVGGRLRDRFGTELGYPDWLSAEDLDVYTAEFERSGFTGPLNRYRNVDRDWEDLAPLARRPVTVPTVFIGGQFDGPTLWGAGAISRFDRTLPALWGSHILEGCGHWCQQERAEQVNELLVTFLAETA